MESATWNKPVIFDEFPKLRELPWLRIGNMPTPVEEVPALAEKLGTGRMFIKRDDKTNAVYGGNKVRKLEFILADVVRQGLGSMLTIGGIGSNHLLATTVHGNSQGLKTHGIVMPQPVTPHVKKSLLLYAHFGTALHLVEGDANLPGELSRLLDENAVKGNPMYFVPAGGSSPLGTIGYVEAAFELRRQIGEGLLPEPDYIFVPCGSGGTAAGLNLGARVAGLNSRVVSVQVTDLATAFLVSQLATITSTKLHLMDRSFPKNIFLPKDLDHRDKFYGGMYGKLTPEGQEAIKMFEEIVGLDLEGVYTGKTAAAIVDAARSGELRGKSVLYWHTFNSVSLSGVAAMHSYEELPAKFHKFFTCDEHTCESA